MSDFKTLLTIYESCAGNGDWKKLDITSIKGFLSMTGMVTKLQFGDEVALTARTQLRVWYQIERPCQNIKL